MDITPYLPYIYSYLAVGAYLTATMIYVSMSTPGELASFWQLVVSAVIHTAFWPVTINFLVRDALGD